MAKHIQDKLSAGPMASGHHAEFLREYAARSNAQKRLLALAAVALLGIFIVLHKEEGVQFGPELVLRGVRERLAPIAMTTLATGLALVPLIAAGSRPGRNWNGPWPSLSWADS